jgi:hypothetical protein
LRKTIDFNADAIFQDVNLREVLNHETRSLLLTTRYNLTPLTTLVLRGEGGNERFAFSPLRNADSIRVMPGIELKSRALIAGTAYVGVRRFTPKSELLAPFTGTVAATSLSYTLKGSTRLTATADRDVTYSYERFQPYYVVTSYGLTVRRQIIGRTDVTVGGTYQAFKYRDLLLPGAPPQDIQRVDYTRSWNASFGYRVSDARIGIGARYIERESGSAAFRNYSGLRVISTVDYEF